MLLKTVTIMQQQQKTYKGKKCSNQNKFIKAHTHTQKKTGYIMSDVGCWCDIASYTVSSQGSLSMPQMIDSDSLGK